MRCRQPLAILGLLYCGALLLCSLLPSAWNVLFLWVVVFVAAFFLVGWLLKKRPGNPLMVGVGFLAVIIAIVISIAGNQERTEVAVLYGIKATVTGRVTEDLSKGDQFCYRMEDALVTGEEGAETISREVDLLLYGNSDLILNRGEEISVFVTVSSSAPSRSQIGKGAVVTAYADSTAVTLLKGSKTFANESRKLFLSNIKTNLRPNLSPESAGLLEGMLLGDQTVLSESVRDDFRVTGLSHILAISGLHIALLGAMTDQILRLFFGRKPWVGLLGLAVMTGYVWLTGMSISAMRALCMMAVALAAHFFTRDYSPLNALGGTALVFCLIAPRNVYEIGFLLSVAAVWAVCAVAPAWEQEAIHLFHLKEHPVVRGFLSLVLSSLAVTLVTLPISVVMNGYLSLLSPLVNMLVLPLTSPILLLGILTAILGSTPIGAFTGKLCDILLQYMLNTARIAGEMDFAILPLRFSYVVFGIVAGALLLLVGWILFRGKLEGRKLLLGAMIACIFSVGALCGTVSTRGTVFVTALHDEGKGQNSIVLSKDGRAIVIGCGESKAAGNSVADYLRSKGLKKLDMVILPDMTKINNGGTAGLLSRMESEVIVGFMESNFFHAASPYFGDSQVYEPIVGKWQVFGDCTLEVRPGKKGAILLFTAKGETLCFTTSKNPYCPKADQVFFYNPIPQSEPENQPK